MNVKPNEPPCSLLLHIPRKVGQGREWHRGLGGKSMERGELGGPVEALCDVCVGVGDDAFALYGLTVWESDNVCKRP